MELSGLIFVALAVTWAVVLIPMALRHHDEAAKTRAVDRFSDDVRVVARREAVTTTESRLVVPGRRRTSAPVSPEPARPTAPPARTAGPRDARPALPNPQVPAQPGPRDVVPDLGRRVAAHRAAAQAAARRRRLVLAVLGALTLGVVVGSATGVLQPWAPAVPAVVVVGFLVLARTLVHREEQAWRAVTARRGATAPAPVERVERVERLEAADIPEAVVPPQPSVPGGPVVGGLDDTCAVPVRITADGTAVARNADGLWDPLPVTLPTYVTKPRAHRTVRTIDLAAPGVVSSGRSAADSALVAEAATAQPAPTTTAERATGS